jgi:uncharacterized membrane protein YqjE
MRLQSLIYISLIVVVDPRYRYQAIQSILCCAYITTLTVISLLRIRYLRASDLNLLEGRTRSQ